MNLTKLEEINEAAEIYVDAKKALEHLPADAAVMAHLAKWPEDMRIVVRVPAPADEVKRACAENPEVPEDFIRTQMMPHISVDIAPEDQQKMLYLLRTLLAARVERLADKLRELGVDPADSMGGVLSQTSIH